MERLTERIEKYIEAYQLPPFGKEVDGTVELLQEVLKKLADYEDLEKQGRLIKLPCKVGDTVYVNGVLGCGEAERYRVIRVDYHSTLGTGRNEFYIEALLCTDPDSSIAFYDKQFGKTVFLTKSEAEQKLKEMNTDNGITEWRKI